VSSLTKGSFIIDSYIKQLQRAEWVREADNIEYILHVHESMRNKTISKTDGRSQNCI
jgi:hypothetical protein